MKGFVALSAAIMQLAAFGMVWSFDDRLAMAWFFYGSGRGQMNRGHTGKPQKRSHPWIAADSFEKRRLERTNKALQRAVKVKKPKMP